MAALVVAVPLGASPVWAASLFGLYALAALGASVLIAAGASWSLLPRLPLVIASYHFGYGIGSLIGWWDVARGVVIGRARLGNLTR